MTMTGTFDSFDPETELISWFDNVRHKVPKNVRIEIRPPKNPAIKSSGTLGLLGPDVVCTITVYCGGVINVNEKVFGNVDFIINKKEETVGRCKDTLVTNLEHLRSVLDECFQDFLRNS
jgi:hypothetical protein